MKSQPLLRKNTSARTLKIRPLTEDWFKYQPLLTIGTTLGKLQTVRPEAVGGIETAYLVQRLISAEVTVGGPYAEPDLQPDFVTNLALAKLLQQMGIALPALERYLLGRLNLMHLRQAAEAAFDGIGYLSQILPASSQAKLGQLLKKLIIDKKLSPTAARRCRLGAAQLEKNIERKTDGKTVRPSSQPYAELYQQAIGTVRQHISQLPKQLQPSGQRIWQRICQADSNREIVLIASFLADSLLPGFKMEPAFLAQLGAANFYCWMSYTVYDDFLDEEGQPALLPIANVAMRQSVLTYQAALIGQPQLHPYVDQFFTAMDTANAWELAHTRFEVRDRSIKIGTLPDYGNNQVLAHRAMAHVLGPLLVVLSLPKSDTAQTSAVQAALCHYLIARQFNDDLHDWRKDLQAGHISPVVTQLLRGSKTLPGRYNFNRLIPKLESYFWQLGLTQTCQQILNHVERARQALTTSQLTRSGGGFQQLLNSLELSAWQTIDIHLDQQAFLQTYQKLQN